jgi:thioredoxin-like negative regulator of GroEL
MANATSDLRSAKALKTELKGSTFTATLAEGYHFNDKAPNGIQLQSQLIKPTTFLPRTLTIEKLPTNATSGEAHLYVCDDKVTFCDMHTIALGKKSTSVTSAISPKKGIGHVNEHGFIVDDFEMVLKTAQQKNELIIVDFGARWCPACIRLENEIFNQKEFQKQTHDSVKSKIDVDVFANRVLLEKYGIKGYPSILFLTSDGHEIARFYDYQPMDFITSVISEVKKYPMAIEDFEKQKLNDDMKLSLARRYFFAGQNAKAVALMEPLNSKPKEYLFAKVAEAGDLSQKDPAQKKNYIKTLHDAIQADPESSRSIVWRGNLIEVLEDQKEEIQKVANESNALTDKILSDEALLKKSVESDFVGEYTGLEGLYIAFANAEAIESVDNFKKQAWEKVIQQGEKYHVDGKMTGASMRVLTAMILSEEYEKALKFVNGMLQYRKDDGDLERRKTRVLLELKKYDEAIYTGEKALKNSYGINEFMVVEPLAKSYIGAGKKDEAKKLLDRYLNSNEINFPEMKSSKKTLEELKKTL